MYKYNISHDHQLLVERALSILEQLNAPITDSAIFIYCHGLSRFGWCAKDKEYQFKIAVNENIRDDIFINTAIHELLHTIPNDNYSPHKGNWKYWANIVSNNTPYKMTVCDDISKINYKKKIDTTPRVICECPICHTKSEIKKTKIHNLQSQYFCGECHKILYSVLPDSPLKNMSIIERKAFIGLALKKFLSLDEIFNYVIYADLEDTRKLARYCLNNYPHNNKVHFKLCEYGCIDKVLKQELAKEYINGDWDNYIHSQEERLNFEGLFSLTKWYMPAVEHGYKVFGPIKLSASNCDCRGDGERRG